MDIWITLRVTHIPTKPTAAADSTPHISSYMYYQLCVFMYSSAASLKNADRLKPCAFAFVVRRSFSSLVIDTSAVALVSPPIDFFGVFDAAVTAASCSFSVSSSKLSKRLFIFFFLGISIISLHSACSSKNKYYISIL